MIAYFFSIAYRYVVCGDYVVSVKKKAFTLLNIFIHKKMKVKWCPRWRPGGKYFLWCNVLNVTSEQLSRDVWKTIINWLQLFFLILFFFFSNTFMLKHHDGKFFESLNMLFIDLLKFQSWISWYLPNLRIWPNFK